MEFKIAETWDFMRVKQLEKYLRHHKGFIAGGIFKNIFNKERYKDVDIFFHNKEDWEEAVKYYSESEDYYFYYENEKVKAFKDVKTNITIECINTVFDTPKEIISGFDFTITQFALYKETIFTDPTETETRTVYKVVYHEDFFTHLHLKRLVIDGLTRELPHIISTFNRCFKYGKYGYFPCRGTKLRIIGALRNISDEEMMQLDGSLYDGFD